MEPVNSKGIPGMGSPTSINDECAFTAVQIPTLSISANKAGSNK
jgi:hypothetical protein